MFLAILFLILGLAILIVGAEALVRGASSFAKRLGISQIVIGLTIVAFGTSAPELIVNIFSALKGASDIATGNIIGSNISNILLILGTCALIAPLSIKNNTAWKEIPFALLAMLLVFTMGNDVFFDGTTSNAITRTDGFSLIAMFAIFMIYALNISKGEKSVDDIKVYSMPISIVLTVMGLIGLFAGGELFVRGAITLAKLAGWSESLIGLTIVAVGTSLPELATCIVATIHKRYDIAIGNVVGSNIFNVFWILGLTSTILQLPFNANTNFDVSVAVSATLLFFAFIFIGKKYELERWQGGVFVASYIAYISYLIYRG